MKIINGITAIYIASVLVATHPDMVASETTTTPSADNQTYVGSPESIVRDNQRLDVPHKDGYRVIVWTASWCAPCKTYRAKEIPKIEKAGIEVTIKDYDRDNPPADIKKVPTVQVYLVTGGRAKLLKQRVYWKATSLIKYMESHAPAP